MRALLCAPDSALIKTGAQDLDQTECHRRKSKDKENACTSENSVAVIANSIRTRVYRM